MGKTKIFIRKPQTLFKTEELYQLRKHELAASIQATYRGFAQKRRYLRMRAAVTVISCHWRRVLAVRLRLRREKAVKVIRKFIVGFMHRREPRSSKNADFLDYVRISYVQTCVREMPKTVLDKNWPRAPLALQEARELLKNMCMKNMYLKYCKGCTKERKLKMQEKVLASALFRQTKSGYNETIAKFFPQGPGSLVSPKHQSKLQPGEKPLYSCRAVKYDRHGYKARERLLAATAKGLYVFEKSTHKLKDHVAYDNLKGISCSGLASDLFVLHVEVTSDACKGDIIMQSIDVSCVEVLTKICFISKRKEVKIVDEGRSITHQLGDDGKAGTIEFVRGGIPSVKKAQNGSLVATVAK